MRPPVGFEYTSDGTTVDYLLDFQTTTSPGSVADNEVIVYVNDQQQTLFADFIVSPWDGSSDRYVTFNTAPADGADIKIFVTTSADYVIHKEPHIGTTSHNYIELTKPGLV